MAKTKIAEYEVSLDDQATAIYNRFVSAVESGSVDISKAMGAATNATRQHGGEVSKLTGYIREQRAENRRHSFVMNEIRDVMGAVSLAATIFGNTLGRTTPQMRELTNALNSGIVAFQGINAVTGFLPGPWGLAASAVGGVAAALLSFNTTSAETVRKIEELRVSTLDLKIALGDLPKEVKEADLQFEIAKSAKEFTRLKEVVTETIRIGKGEHAFDKVVTRVVGTPEEIAAAENALLRARNALNNFQTTAAISGKSVASAAKQVNDSAFGSEAIDQIDTWAGIYAIRQRSVLRGYEEIGKRMDELNRKADEDIAAHRTRAIEAGEVMSNVFSIATSALQSGFQAAFSGQDDAAKQFFKAILTGTIDMVQGMLFAAAAALYVKSVLSFGLTAGPDFAMLAAATVALQAARAIVATFHEGGIMGMAGQRVPFRMGADERPAILKVGETVRTPKQEAALRGGGTTVVINFNSPVPHGEWVKKSIEQGLRATGLPVDKYLVNTRDGLVRS